jgi:hypothetical protein
MFFETLRRIKSIATRHSGKTYTPEKLTHLIRMQFRDPQLQFKTGRNRRVARGNFWIGGEYRCLDDEQDEPCITITLTYSAREDACVIDHHDWDSMAFHIADVITHEYLHQYYSRQRGYRNGPGYRDQQNLRYSESMQDYLGCEDEIQAHAFNVCSEMLVYGKKMEQTKTYKLYNKHFKDDPKVVLKLKKQVRKYIKRWEQSNEQVGPRTRIHNR